MVLRNIAICLDTTASMGSSLEACREAIKFIIKVLSIISNVEFTFVVFGDYDNRHTNIKKVVKVLENIKDILNVQLNSYGSGGDMPEANASALFTCLHIKGITDIIFITDAVPHKFYYSTRHINGKLCDDSETQYLHENKALNRKCWIDLVQESQKKGIKLHIINSCSYATSTCFYKDINDKLVSVNGPFGTYESNINLPDLTTQNVLAALLDLVNDFSEGNISKSIEHKHVFDIFWEIVRSNPEVIKNLNFLSKGYYNAVRKGKLQNLHSDMIQKSRSSLPAELLEELIEFSNNQYETISVKSLWKGKICKRYIVYSGKHFKPKEIADIFAKSDPEGIEELGKGFKVTDKTDESLGLPLESFEYILGLAAINEEEEEVPIIPGNFSNFMSCLAHYNKDNYIASKAFEFILGKDYQEWLCHESSKLAPDSVWSPLNIHLMELAFQRAISNTESASKVLNKVLNPEKAKSKLELLKRLRRLMKLRSFDQYVKNVVGEISPEGLPEDEVVRFIDYIPMVWCALMCIFYPETIMFPCELDKVKEIIENLRRRRDMFFHPGEFRWTDEHLELLEKKTKEKGKCHLSIYAICCHIDDNEYHPIESLRKGYRDDYARYSYVSDKYTKFSTPKNSDDFERLFKIDGLTTKINKSDIKKDGPELHLCSSCNCIYCVHDTSHGDYETKKCGNCRKGVYQFKTYRRECTGCNRGYISGIRDDPINPEKCIYCSSKSKKKIESDQVSFLHHIIDPNIEVFSNNFGIPPQFIRKYIDSGCSMAKMFREDPSDKETARPLGSFPDLYSEHGWNKTKTSLGDLKIKINGFTVSMSEDTFDRVKEIIMNSGKINCSICFDSFKKTEIHSLCKNPKCVTQICSDCIKGTFAGISPGEYFSRQHIACSFCNSALKPGLVKEYSNENRKISERNALIVKDKLVKDICLGPDNIGLCEEVDCESPFPYFVIGAVCGADEVEPEKGSRRCEHCVKRLFVPPSTKPKFPMEGGTVDEHGFCWVDNTPYRQCPNDDCGTIYTNSRGCFHMSCNCGIHTCWGCGEIFDSSEIYEHISTCTKIRFLADHPEEIRRNYFWYRCEEHNPDRYNHYDYY